MKLGLKTTLYLSILTISLQAMQYQNVGRTITRTIHTPKISCPGKPHPYFKVPYKKQVSTQPKILKPTSLSNQYSYQKPKRGTAGAIAAGIGLGILAEEALEDYWSIVAIEEDKDKMEEVKTQLSVDPNIKAVLDLLNPEEQNKYIKEVLERGYYLEEYSFNKKYSLNKLIALSQEATARRFEKWQHFFPESNPADIEKEWFKSQIGIEYFIEKKLYYPNFSFDKYFELKKEQSGFTWFRPKYRNSY